MLIKRLFTSTLNQTTTNRILACYCNSKPPSPPNNNYPLWSFLFLFAYTCDNINRLDNKIDQLRIYK